MSGRGFVLPDKELGGGSTLARFLWVFIATGNWILLRYFSEYKMTNLGMASMAPRWDTRSVEDSLDIFFCCFWL